jgi:hypothetical protein
MKLAHTACITSEQGERADDIVLRTVVEFAAIDNIWIAFVESLAIAGVARITRVWVRVPPILANAISANASICSPVFTGACARWLIPDFPSGIVHLPFIRSGKIDCICIPQEEAPPVMVVQLVGIGIIAAAAAVNELEFDRIRFNLVTKEDPAASNSGAVVATVECCSRHVRVLTVRAGSTAAGLGRLVTSRSVDRSRRV